MRFLSFLLCAFLTTSVGVQSYAPRGGFPVSAEVMNVMERKEEILQEQLAILEEEYSRVEREKKALITSIVQANRRGKLADRVRLESRLTKIRNDNHLVQNARERLLALSEDKERYEKFLAEGIGQVIADNSFIEDENEIVNSGKRKEKRESKVIHGSGKERYTLAWPVFPAKGISAYFMEESYRKHFGFDHTAIDIPARQGSSVRAARSGTVEKVNDNGYGYSTLVLRHGTNLKTVYGHVSKFLVKEGQMVAEGQVIAKSGGLPGTLGAGPFTTGPHLHFEAYVGGVVQNPIVHLPSLNIVFNKVKRAIGGYRK